MTPDQSPIIAFVSGVKQKSRPPLWRRPAGQEPRRYSTFRQSNRNLPAWRFCKPMPQVMRLISRSAASLMDPGLEEFLKETGIRRLWIELHPVLLEEDPDHYLQRINELAGDFRRLPCCGSVDLASRILDKHPGIKNIALKGNEASGFTRTRNDTDPVRRGPNHDTGQERELIW